MKFLTIFLTLLLTEMLMPQSFDFEQSLYNNYGTFKEKSLVNRRFKYSDIQPLIDRLKNSKDFTVIKVGESAEGRDLNLISAGHGERNVFLWSQMHGDEPTATAALFDIFNFLNDTLSTDFKNMVFSKLKIYFLPMVNPDGAEQFKRRNIFNIDLNRDAARLQTPEALVLKNVFDSLKAEFGFNLHDQDTRYSVGNSFKCAALSFLAPPINYEKTVNKVRDKSIKLIGYLDEMLKQFIPGHVAKYSDDYEPRAFGDNFQKWGTSTILIESGGWENDREKQFLRKLNFITILSAIKSIAEGSYQTVDKNVYEKIPFNDKYIFDVILRNLNYQIDNKNIKVDVAINFEEKAFPGKNDYYLVSQTEDLGDLSVFFGYEDYDFTGYSVKPGKTYRDKIFELKDISTLNLTDLYSKGFTGIIIKSVEGQKYSPLPINLIVDKNYKDPDIIDINKRSDLIIYKDNAAKYAIINGFLQNLDGKHELKGNGLIVR